MPLFVILLLVVGYTRCIRKVLHKVYSSICWSMQYKNSLLSEKCYWSLKHIFKQKMQMKLKKKVFNSRVVPTILCNAQTWALNKILRKKIRTNQTKMKRTMFDIRLSDKITIQAIRRRTGVQDIVERRSRQLKWNWAGHIMRLQNYGWTKFLQIGSKNNEDQQRIGKINQQQTADQGLRN